MLFLTSQRQDEDDPEKRNRKGCRGTEQQDARTAGAALSVMFFLEAVGVHLGKLISWALGRRGLSVPTYRSKLEERD
jgi:hypothetical protein